MPYIIAAVVVLLFLIVFLMGYVKAPPDTAVIISGLRKRPRVLIGKAGVKIPFLERRDALLLQLIAIDVKTSSAVPTADYINIRVDANVNVKVSDVPDQLQRAAQNFLNKKVEYIQGVAREVLEGNMREIVGQMRLEEMVSDRQLFAEKVKENAAPDLSAMGLEIVSFNVQNFVDDANVIENLGVDNVVKIQKNAAISRAQSEKEIKVAQARAAKEANDAQVDADTAIAERRNQLQIRQAELKKESDVKRAESDAAYEIEKQTQRRTIEVTAAEADIARQTKEVELKQREADVAEQELAAKVKKQADAELYRRQKAAEAEKFEAERAAEALRYQKQQEAEGIRMVGEAEADAIRQKGVAEAEAMLKKAEAYKQYNGAAMGEMIIKILPDVAARIAQPISAIDKVSIIGGDASGVGGVADNVPALMAKTFQTVQEATGIDLREIVRADSYDAKVNRRVDVKLDAPLPVRAEAEAPAPVPPPAAEAPRPEPDGRAPRR